ncbi:olfactory receptor 6B1-like [Motacilla alba alba]|uniref:olfactory receptor 6B1-like n=1 Tax=Motacilla alba alba TaxID=1094192 RepID=UPI0018D51FF5|nr:olfactory receptor 6B1-like [Motacilla alba alba]
MAQENATHIHEFILLGFPTTRELQAVLFVIFLTVYLLTVTENIVIITLIITHPQLHKPMYFFLGHLAFLEACYISVTVPRLLLTLVVKNKNISFTSCMAQLYFFIALVCTECVLLAAMAYDRYVAICTPLHYTLAMGHRACLQLAMGSWLLGFLIAVLKVFFISQLSFCSPGVINHFFCDISPLLNLSCTQRRLAETVDFISALFTLLIPLSVIIISYTCIIRTVLLIPKAQNRKKAFSTCASHLAVVIIFFSATLFMYARPRSANSRDLNKLVSIIYTIVTPMLNPCIYCLRNQEVKDTLLKVLCRRTAPSRVSVSHH